MTETRHRYVVRLEAENGKVVTAALEQVGSGGSRSLAKIETAAAGADARLSALSRSILTRIVPTFTVAGIAGAAQRAVKSLGDLQDAADRIGTSAEKLQVFRLIGQDAGMAEQAVDQSLQTFIKRLGEAEAGTGKLLDVVKRYNIELTNADGSARNWADILGDLSMIIAQTGDVQEQLYIAGRMGMEDMLDVLRRGPGAIGELEQKYRDLGVVIDDEVVKKADEIDKAYTLMIAGLQARWKTFVVDMVAGAGDLHKAATEAAIALGQRAVGAPAASGPGAMDVFDFMSGDLQDAMSGVSRAARAPSRSRFGTDPDAASKVSREAEREQQKIAAVIESLEFRNQQLARGAEEQALYNELRSAGTTLDTAAGKQIAVLVDQMQKMERAQERNKRVTEAWNSGIDDIITNFDDLRSVGLRALSDLLQGFLSLASGQKASSSLGGLLAEGLFSIFSPAETFGPFLPGRAVGGPVAAGGAYLVGERGPEILKMGGRSGSITPNHALGGDTYNIYAPNADSEGLARVEATIRALNGRVNQIDRSVEPRAVAAVQDRKRRSLNF